MGAERLVLSLFPGIGLLDRAFEEEGFCIVRGPDVLWGGDIKLFHPPAGIFAGIIGGDPCQAHMRLASFNRALGREPRYPDMTPEFARIIRETQPDWWLRENSPLAPDLAVPGYAAQKLMLNNRWVGGVQNRTRNFWFGSKCGARLQLEVALFEQQEWDSAVLSGHGGVRMRLDRGGIPKTQRSMDKASADARRPWERLCELQGLPGEFLSDAPFTFDGKKRVLANGVPLPMGRAVARAVRQAMGFAGQLSPQWKAMEGAD